MDTATNEVEIIERLDSSESYRLHGYEQTIERGLATFHEVGAALIGIRDGRLYRASHSSFDAYLEERWSMGRRRADQLISAAEVVDNLMKGLGTNGSESVTTPANERQARELAQLDPDTQLVVWRSILSTAPDGKVTAGHIKSVATVYEELRDTGAIDPGDGEMIAVSDILTAAVTEETYERTKRQQEHIRENLDKKAGGNGDGAALAAQDAAKGTPPAGVAPFELYTPEWLIDRVRFALGGVIDLDPASSAEANTVVRANNYFDIQANGLTQQWNSPAVWVNHPYGDKHNLPWAQKILLEHSYGRAPKIIALVMASVSSQWFALYANYPRCFPDKRVAFWGPADKGDGPRFDSAIIGLGIDLDVFAEAFEDIGAIYTRYTRGNKHRS